jgi:prolipoprotein diacylglyceryl transferase
VINMKKMSFKDLLNRVLDKTVRPELRLGARVWPAFRVCFCAGVCLAVTLTMVLTILTGQSPLVMLAISAAGIATFFALAMLIKLITSREQMAYYHFEIAVMFVAALLLRWLNVQPLVYLDLTIMSIGACQICVRLGCLMAGCCHGRSSTLGVCYRDEHARDGFTPYYVGVRLFPIQVVESLWVCCLVLVGSALILSGSAPGTTLSWYVMAYGIGRFTFEFVRGDTDRPYFAGFSEAQWISLILMSAVVWAEMKGHLVFRVWHVAALGAMVAVMIVVALNSRIRRQVKQRLLHPQHVREVAYLLAMLSDLEQKEVRIGSTFLGVQISASTFESEAGQMYHYALSCEKEVMTEATAHVMATLICRLKHLQETDELLKRRAGVFHLFAQPVTR